MFGVPATLTVHALERQEPSALLRLHILLEGEDQPLQPGDDLRHPPCPAGTAERRSGLQGGPYYIVPRRPLKGQALWRPHHHPRRAAPPRPAAVSRSCPTQRRRAWGPTSHPGNTRPAPAARCWGGTREAHHTARLQATKHADFPKSVFRFVLCLPLCFLWAQHRALIAACGI